MAIGATANWYIRVNGSSANGGGFDSGIASAGTNYADSDTPQATLTTLSVVGATTTQIVVSLTDYTVSANDIGNCFLLASGTATVGYYFITAVNTGTNTWTMDRSVGTAAQTCVGKMGGAHAKITQYANGGGGTQPSVTTPLVPGNQVNIRGGGTDDPSSADYTNTNYLTFPNGTSAGSISWVGYNGRPYIQSDGLTFYAMVFNIFQNIKIGFTGTQNGALGAIDGVNGGGTNSSIDNCYIDQLGYDNSGFRASSIKNCRFTNTGATTTAGSNYAITGAAYNPIIVGNTINGWRGGGIASANGGAVINNLIINTKANPGIDFVVINGQFMQVVYGNTIYNNAGDGIKLVQYQDTQNAFIMNNIITNNGGWGINNATGTTALNTTFQFTKIDYNNYGTGGTANTSGAINAGTLGPHDLQLDPQFTNAAGGDFSVGTNMKAVGFPAIFPH